MNLTGWGQFPKIKTSVSRPRDVNALIESLKMGDAIARGNGRSYGDSSISHTNTIQMAHFNRMLSFDQHSGQLVVEAGVMLSDIIDTFLQCGWFPAVTPGTKFVTIGGMIAADVHGKNHHRDGSFGAFVDWIDLLGPSGIVQRCSRKDNPNLFNWTVGGMGLTGIIVRAAIRLRSVETGWIKQRTIAAANISEAIELFESSLNINYSVAWIDCMQRGRHLGRSLIMLGEHARLDDLENSNRQNVYPRARSKNIYLPLNFPSWVLNKYSVKAFNNLYYRKGQLSLGEHLIDCNKFFYPLDRILGWNKVYGRNGFAQFQCVIPLEKSIEGITALLNEISKSKCGSFLSVLKRLGVQESNFSFPMEGYTLALDFPVNQKTLDLMKRLDKISIKYGGRFYLAKDSRMSRETLEKSDLRLPHYHRLRDELDLSNKFSSAQSERLGI